jgi:DNA-binding NarL/FixJ family response regulator
MTRRKASPAAELKKKALLVDDHPIVRHGLSMLINNESDLTVCGEADDAQRALRLITMTHPDIVVVDLFLKNASGLDLIKDIKIRFPQLPTLVLSMQEESLYAERSLLAGARGYITKQQAIQHIASAIRKVLNGEIHVSEEITKKILDRVLSNPKDQENTRVGALSDRELEVFRLIGRGFGPQEIARQLGLSVKTVDSHREKLKRKLNLTSAAELTRYAVEWMRSESATLPS